MRFLWAVAAILLAAPAALPAEPTQPIGLQKVGKSCPRTSSYLAGDGAVQRGRPPAMRKLSELPPATAYMSVYRTVNGCEFPMTLTEYRGARPRK